MKNILPKTLLNSVSRLEQKQKLISIIVWLFPLGLVSWIAWQHLIPTGKLHLSCSAVYCSRLLKSLSTHGRGEIIATTNTQDPLRIDVLALLPFSKATVTTEFTSEAPELNVTVSSLLAQGKLIHKESYLKNPLLDGLKENWNIVRDGDTALYTRPGATNTFRNVQEFLDNRPPIDQVRSLQYDLRYIQDLPGYMHDPRERDLEHILLGPHDIITYIQNEPLDFTFTFQELGQDSDKSDMRVIVKNGSTEFFNKKITEDNIGTSSMHVHLEGIPTGVYHIVMNVHKHNTAITSIKTRQSRIMFLDHVFVIDNDAYQTIGAKTKEINLYAIGSKLTASTAHQENTQTLIVDGKELVLNAPSKIVSTHLSDFKKPTAVFIPKSDVLISTKYIALSKDAIFDPDFNKAKTLGTELSNNTSYVIADEPIVKASRGWITTTNTFNARELYRNIKGLYSFFIESPPQLDEEDTELKIRRVDIVLERAPLTWDLIRKKLASFFKTR